jgi:hypothetical protein
MWVGMGYHDSSIDLQRVDGLVSNKVCGDSHECCCECGNGGNSQQALQRAQFLWLSNIENVVENKHNFPPQSLSRWEMTIFA